jgi:DNA-directed RNA polymerase specialized sigma24 family protein
VSDEPYFRWLSRFFFAPGYDAEDLLQEARLAAWLAPHCPRLAARRRLIEIVRRSKRAKRPELCAPVDVADPADVVDLVLARERLREVARAPLSELEREAIRRVAIGEGCSEKTLDNALHRARRKLSLLDEAA